jgi:putative endonuclease
MTAGLGAFGESWAAGYLSRRGYTILERNVRYRRGEIDIVAREGPDLVFVEVKCRRGTRFGPPEESITPRRFARLATAIQEYLQRSDLDPTSYRVDVVALEVSSAGRVTRCQLLRAVEAPLHSGGRRHPPTHDL